MHRRIALLAIVLATIACQPDGAIAATPIHKCQRADGHVTYQDIACPADNQELPVGWMPREVTPADTAARPHTHSWPQRPALLPRVVTRPARSRPVAAAVSYECRASNGEVFYQHVGCPATIPADLRSAGKSSRRRRNSGSGDLAVTGRPIARAEACRRIHAASASDRPGHARDEDVSTYERILGRDSCD
ncbi:hypothetical protein [Tahibacter amnicola]|uniref:DUF4124 domain-containing protein n=1 Tax=Tahibacter amnicola TaxID=2976241 RepID=A0ABY6BJ42_9GAMM|nr:hypothetical protein [Tahibacter amnicola]UXI67857.1 hypothetical protein N4264_24520 [Tahibacter amnicola]